MKIIIKILITLIIILTLPITIYYGLQLQNTNYTYEYTNTSYVVTLPNKVWLELNTSQDTIDEQTIFDSTNPNIKKEGINFGLKYPTYTVVNETNTIKQTLIGSRVEDTLTIKNNINVKEEQYDTYTTHIYFSQYGIYSDNTYIQDGCYVEVNTKVGDMEYDQEHATLNITYDISQGKVEDNITMEISCE
jgi:hypothetical protein